METKTAILWSGGKDSALAQCLAEKEGYKAILLVTFTSEQDIDFLAHPKSFIKKQSKALDIPHIFVPIIQPYETGYTQALKEELKGRHNITTLITGEIDEKGDKSAELFDAAEKLNIEIIRPLWKRNRKELLRMLPEEGVKAIFSLVKKPWFSSSWLGDELNAEKIEELIFLSSMNSVDIVGEGGEYHSLAVDSPLFLQALHVDEYEVRQEGESIFYMDINSVSEHNKK